MTLVKCTGTHNVADALTKSLPGPAWSTHCPYLTCTRTEYKVFFLTLFITEQTVVAWAEAARDPITCLLSRDEVTWGDPYTWQLHRESCVHRSVVASSIQGEMLGCVRVCLRALPSQGESEDSEAMVSCQASLLLRVLVPVAGTLVEGSYSWTRILGSMGFGCTLVI
eukprot:3041519-Rhodomonas_salina.1